VRAGQTHPHRPRLVVSHSTCPPLSSSPHAHSFVIGPAVIKHTHGAICTHGDATRDLEFIGGDKDRQLKQVWTETRIGNILPWDEIADEAETLRSHFFACIQKTLRE
jgi:hypothetical protein